MRSKIDLDLLRIIRLFEQVTRASVMNCFTYKGKLTFIVPDAQTGKALGRGLVNIKKLESMLNRKIKIVGFHPERLTFITRLLHPLRVSDMKEEDDVITIKGPDTKTKGLIIGARAQNLRETEDIVRKFFPCQEIKVV